MTARSSSGYYEIAKKQVSIKQNFNQVVTVRLKIFFILLLPLFGINIAVSQVFIDQSELYELTTTVTSDFNGNGLSTYDFNHDGMDDISVTTSVGMIQFYKNNNDSFILEDFGIITNGFTKQILWVDYDNDGDSDILTTTTEGQTRLYNNNGDLNFTDVTLEAGLPLYSAENAGACFGDYDLDGDLDLYVCRYVLAVADPNSPELFNRLYRNEGDGTFTDVTESSQILMPPSVSFQSVWLDANNDQWPDLFVINDKAPSNFLFINNGDGTFSEDAENRGIGLSNGNIMTNTVGDFDHDNDLDVFMTNAGFEETGGSYLAVNQNNGFFDESTETYGVEIFDFSWGGVWLDVDNDSWEDLLFVTREGNPTYYFHNEEGNNFTDLSSEVSSEDNVTGFSPARCDINNDGFYDVAVQNENLSHPSLLMNQGGANGYIKITLEGAVSNKDAIGSWINVYANGSASYQYTHCGGNYLGQNSQHLIFGLGEASIVDSILVKYPSGHIDSYYNLPVNSTHYFTEGDNYTASITVNQQPPVCEGDSILLNAGLHESYLWSNGDTTQTIWAQISGIYSVAVENQLGLQANTEVEIQVFDNPIISAVINQPLCAGDSTGSIQLVNQMEIDPALITWDNGDFGNQIDSLQSGEYQYIYEDVNGCITSGSVSLIEPTAMQFLASSTPEVSGNEDGTITITIFGGTEPYEIYLDNELVASPLSNLEAGTYQFTIIDSNGCIDQLTADIESILNIANLEFHEISVFPNPIANHFKIETEGRLRSIQILALNGEIVLNLTPNLSGNYSLENLSNGVYILKIQSEDGTNSVFKIVKKSSD